MAQGINIISWNLNGIRSNILSSTPFPKKGSVPISSDSNLGLLISKYNPDIICFQETRCPIDIWSRIEFKYEFTYLNFSTSKNKGRGCGYSGTGVLSRYEPLNVTYNLETDKGVDNEGRVITLEYEEFYLVNVYTPNSGTNEDYRINDWDHSMKKHIIKLEKNKPVILLGDMNVCHKETDLHKKMPNAKQRIAGLLPEERMNFSQYINIGMIDTFRYIHNDLAKYTWWSPLRKSNRENNLGWRIDYILVSKALEQNIKESQVLDDVYGSDHCPIQLNII